MKDKTIAKEVSIIIKNQVELMFSDNALDFSYWTDIWNNKASTP